MIEKLNKIRQDNPRFNEEFVDYIFEIMPKLSGVMAEGYEFDCHIGSKDVAKLAEPYITNHKGEHIGFKWSYEDVINVARNYINIDDAEFYPCDLWVWANVKYGDMGHIINDSQMIIKYAISELTDSDFPFYAASQRAYYWLKKHIENKETD